ncbi:MAG: hypothetical protein FWD42_02060 [Solirubrobacterales bacterium]|nr:hypothetical protein [Solirubrobacterales bacterium]
MPALPLHQAGPYVAAAYIVVFALVLIYVAIMAVRLTRMERTLGELLRRGERERPPEGPAREDSSRGEEGALAPGGAAPSSGEEGALAPGGAAGDESGALDVGRPERTPA